MSTPDGEQDITLTCEECGESITGAARGKGSAAWKLGTHRYVKHKQTSKAPSRSGPTSDELAGDGASPVLAAVHSISDAVGTRGKQPSADELARGLGRGLGLTTVAVASLMVESDPAMDAASQSERDALIDELSLSDKAARDVMAPIGRAMAGTRINARYGRKIVDNVDVVGSVSELAILGVAWRRYLAARAGGHRMIAGGGGLNDPYRGPAPSNADAAAAGLPVFVDQLATPAPQTGTLAGPEMVEQIRRQQGGG